MVGIVVAGSSKQSGYGCMMVLFAFVTWLGGTAMHGIVSIEVMLGGFALFVVFFVLFMQEAKRNKAQSSPGLSKSTGSQNQ